jgi:hypothetical protein
MSTRIAYIEKLTRIASREKGMRRAFLLAKVREAEAESDEQFCKKMRITEVADSADGASKERVLSSDSDGRVLSSDSKERVLSSDSTERVLSSDANERVLSGDSTQRVLTR